VINGHVAVQDLLQHLGSGDQTLGLDNGALEQCAGGILVGMRGADQVHRDVRVDEDHTEPR
jgi:hypothetical protein